MPELGHIAYYVRNLERSVAFYQKVVGLKVVARIFDGRAAVLSGNGDRHHELLLIQVSTGDGPLVGRRIGLYHTGWKVGAALDDLRAALDRAQLHGTQVDGTANHQVMFSLYLRDPDDNEVELFVDNPIQDWRNDSSWMDAPVQPLDLSRLQPHEKAGFQPPTDTTNGNNPANIAPVVASAEPSAEIQPSGNEVGEDQYDEAEDPDELSYWLRYHPNANSAAAVDVSQAPMPVADAYAEVLDASDDPDDIEYWLKTTNLSPGDTTAQLANETQEDNDGLDDPDDIQYWIKTIQTPPRKVQAELDQEQAPQTAALSQEEHEEPYNEQDDPDALEYWLKTATNSAVAETPPKDVQPYDELKDPDSIGYRPTKAA